MASTSDVHTILQEIAFKGSILNKTNHGDARRGLLAAARSLCYKLETPIESLLRICWAEVSILDLHAKEKQTALCANLYMKRPRHILPFEQGSR